jgi:hypothetical protein
MKAHPTACFWAFMMCFTIVSHAVSTHPSHSNSADFLPTGHGILLHVPERQLRRPALLQKKIRSRDRPQRSRRDGLRNPDKVAVISLPSRPVWCIRWSASRRPRYEPIGLPMDDTACSVPDECNDLHHLLRKLCGPRCGRTLLTNPGRFSGGSRYRTGIRRCPMGLLHRKQPCLRQ